MPTYQATVNEQSYPIEAADLERLNLIPTSDGSYHFLDEDGTAYRIEVEELDLRGKRVTLSINGRRTIVQLADEVDQLVDRLGFSAAAGKGSGEVLAPMPGLVLKILVEEGQEVEAGTPLVVLEAMKMENVLRAEVGGMVKTVSVKPGAAVEKKQVLVELE